MARFSSTVESTADVAASRAEVWSLLTDPAALVRLTPLLTLIEAEGDTWVWHMVRVGGLGVSLTPVFTEAMTFEEETSIVFDHRPPAGAKERIGAHGRYDLSDSATGVALAVSLTVTADLPLPRSASGGVSRVMKQTMSMMGDRFSRNLLAELGAAAPA